MKVASTVRRGRGGSNVALLPDNCGTPFHVPIDGSQDFGEHWSPDAGFGTREGCDYPFLQRFLRVPLGARREVFFVQKLVTLEAFGENRGG